MRKLVLATSAALLLGSAAMVTPAQAYWTWNGFSWVWVAPDSGWGWARHERWCYWRPFRCW